MNVREKLVELIAQKVCDTWSESCDEWLPHDCGKCYANDCHISEIADHLIANGVTVQEWISVTERLPEPFVSVLVYMPGEEPFPTVHEGFISKDGIWQSEMLRREPGEVTHWKPMPQPPKGE